MRRIATEILKLILLNGSKIPKAAEVTALSRNTAIVTKLKIFTGI